MWSFFGGAADDTRAAQHPSSLDAPDGAGAAGAKPGWAFLDLIGVTDSEQAAAPSAGAKAHASRKASAAGGGGGQRAAVIQPPSDALAVLQAAISAIDAHFAKAQTHGKPVEMLGNDQKNKEIAVLVRGQLCTALSRVHLLSAGAGAEEGLSGVAATAHGTGRRDQRDGQVPARDAALR